MKRKRNTRRKGEGSRRKKERKGKEEEKCSEGLRLQKK